MTRPRPEAGSTGGTVARLMTRSSHGRRSRRGWAQVPRAPGRCRLAWDQVPIENEPGASLLSVTPLVSGSTTSSVGSTRNFFLPLPSLHLVLGGGQGGRDFDPPGEAPPLAGVEHADAL